jgi:hypothetical protein
LRALEPLEERTVLSSISEGPGDTTGLYAAITAAITAAGHGTVNIQLSPGTYTLTGTELDITASSHKVIIHGNGAVIDAAGKSRVLETDAGTDVTLQDLELTGGLVTGTLAQGGGILNLGGNLSLNDVVVDHDTAQGSAGVAGGTGGTAQGGGLFTDGGLVSIQNSKLSSDTAQGGIGGSGALAGGGTGGNGQGGGLYAGGGSISLTNSSVTDNTASTDGGGIFEVVVLTLINTDVTGNTPADIS